MRKKSLFARAGGVLGVVMLLSLGLHGGHAGAEEVVHDPNFATTVDTECHSNHITISLGSVLGLFSNNNGNVGQLGVSYTIRGFCGEYNLGSLDAETGLPLQHYALDMPDDYPPPPPNFLPEGNQENPAAYPASVPSYTGLANEPIPGWADAPRSTQWDNYRADLLALFGHVYNNLGAPGYDANWSQSQYDEVWKAANNVVANVDLLNYQLGKKVPGSASATHHPYWHTYWGSGYWNLVGPHKSTDGLTVSSQSFVYHSYNQDYNGGNPSWVGPLANGIPSPWGSAGSGGGLALGAGCVAGLTGGANGVWNWLYRGDWRALYVSSCGIGGGTSQGGAILLGGVSIEYVGHVQGQEV